MPDPIPPGPTLLRLTDIAKHFGGVRALGGVSFDLHAGEVHAIVGENGAGKSTLIQVIAGTLAAGAGTVEIDGHVVGRNTPALARSLGVAVVYQQPPDLVQAAKPYAVLAGPLLGEVALFSVVGVDFATAGNAGQIVRTGSELGLVALAMTGVILTGGIDLSVGSTLGLSAVVLGKLWRDGHVPIGVAAVVVLALGAVAGLVNSAVITRLRVRPLIVTLGTLSLYRGRGRHHR